MLMLALSRSPTALSSPFPSLRGDRTTSPRKQREPRPLAPARAVPRDVDWGAVAMLARTLRSTCLESPWRATLIAIVELLRFWLGRTVMRLSRRRRTQPPLAVLSQSTIGLRRPE